MTPASASTSVVGDLFEPLFRWLTLIDTTREIVFACVVLAFLLALLVRGRDMVRIFGLLAVVVCVVFLGKEIFPELLDPPLRVRVRVADATDRTAKPLARVYVRRRGEPDQSEEGRDVVVLQIRSSQMPAETDRLVYAKADGYLTAETTQLVADGDDAYDAILSLVPRPANVPMREPAPPAGDPPKSTPAVRLDPADVRSWRIAVFGCTEHAEKAGPDAERLRRRLTERGYVDVRLSTWPLAGTRKVVDGQSFYHALTSPLTLNYTEAKVAQMQDLKRALEEVEGLPPVSPNIVGTAFSRYLSVVLCPGFTDADRFQ